MNDSQRGAVSPEKTEEPAAKRPSRPSRDKQLFTVKPTRPFLAREFNPVLGWALLNFVIGFFLAWIMCIATFKYVFATLFAV